MREIKFRAWNKEKNIMCYDNEDYSERYLDGIFSSNVSLINYWLAPDRLDDTYVYMQFTGQKDKNGREIYEGDIISGPFDFGPGGFDVRSAVVRFHPQRGTYQLNYWLIEESEVIGNEFENPELLERNYD
jgi:hypothetical protein